MKPFNQALIQHDWCPAKKRGHEHRHTQREDHVKIQTEDGQLQAKDRGLRRSQPCRHFGLGLLLTKICEKIYLNKCMVSATQFVYCDISCSFVSNFLRPHGLQPTRLLCPWDSPGKNTAVGCHFLFKGIFLTQGSNPGLLHCRQMLSPLSHQGSPIISSLFI